jgi:hypothetical protein
MRMLETHHHTASAKPPTDRSLVCSFPATKEFTTIHHHNPYAVVRLLYRHLGFGINEMAPTTASKKAKKGSENIASKLALVIKSGKYSLGYKSTLKQMRSGKGE